MSALFYDGPPRVFRPMPITRMIEVGIAQEDAEQAWRDHQTRTAYAAIAKIHSAAYGDADAAEAVALYTLYAEALRYDAAGRPASPAAADYPMLTGGEAAARGMTLDEFTDYALSTGSAWAQFAAEVRAVRAQVTVAIAGAPDPEDVSAIVDPALTALKVAASSL